MVRLYRFRKVISMTLVNYLPKPYYLIWKMIIGCISISLKAVKYYLLQRVSTIQLICFVEQNYLR